MDGEKPPRNKGGGSKKGRRYRKVPPLLNALRHVFREPKSKDAKEAHHKARELYEKDQSRFLTLLGQEERAFKAGAPKPLPGKAGAAPEGEGQADEGTEKALGQIERILRGEGQ